MTPPRRRSSEPRGARGSWITHVYGPERTRKGPFRVQHMIGYQGTRYEIDFRHQSSLRGELRAGRRRIDAWLRKAGLLASWQTEAPGEATQPGGAAGAGNMERPVSAADGWTLRSTSPTIKFS